MKTYKIAVIPGDGTGGEVVREGNKVLTAAAEKYGFKLDRQEYDLGGERYMRTGEVLPDSVIEELRGFQAIYLGAVGHPDVSTYRPPRPPVRNVGHSGPPPQTLRR